MTVITGGRNMSQPRIFWEIVRRAIQRQMTYRAATLAGLATNFFFGLLRAAVLVALYGTRQQVAGMSMQDAITYTGLTQAIIAYLSFFGWYDLAQSVYSGQVGADLLKPINLFTFWMGQDLGRALVQMALRGLPLMAFYALAFRIATPKLGGPMAGTAGGPGAGLAGQLRVALPGQPGGVLVAQRQRHHPPGVHNELVPFRFHDAAALPAAMVPDCLLPDALPIHGQHGDGSVPGPAARPGAARGAGVAGGVGGGTDHRRAGAAASRGTPPGHTGRLRLATHLAFTGG